MSARSTIALAAALSLGHLSVVASKTPTLDYEFFKAKVEPIFLKKREGHTDAIIRLTRSGHVLSSMPVYVAPKTTLLDEQRPHPRQAQAQ